MNQPYCRGGRFGGYGFYLLKGKPVFLWNLVDLKRPRWEGTTALSKKSGLKPRLKAKSFCSGA
jgi:hypothetical protein